MNIDYIYIRKECIDWYAKEGGMYSGSAFPIDSRMNIEHHNSLGDVIDHSKFEKLDIASIKIKGYSEEGYIFFITARSYNPKAGLFQSSWRYQGHIMKVESDGITYVTTPALIPQRKLKRLEQKDSRKLEHRV